MKVVITGGTGFIGRHLCRRLLDEGHEVVTLTRDAKKAQHVLPPGVTCLPWTPGQTGEWVQSLHSVGGVVHLAAEVVMKYRMNGDFVQGVNQRRIQLIDGLLEGMRQVTSPPRAFLSASAVTYYGESCHDTELTEDSPPGQDILAQGCLSWEQAAQRAETHNIRPVHLRIGFVLGQDGGVLEPILPMFRSYLGVRIGSPDQWIPWIHIDDITGFIIHALQNQQVTGAFNLTAPHPTRSQEFFATLGRVLGHKAWLPIPPALVKLMMGDTSRLLLSSICALPKRVSESGYVFRYPDLAPALQQLFPTP